MSDQTAGLTYKGRPLMRKDNMIYYGSMADSHIVMLQVLDSKPVNGLNVATRVSVQLLSNEFKVPGTDCKEERKRRPVHGVGCWLCLAGARSGKIKRTVRRRVTYEL